MPRKPVKQIHLDIPRPPIPMPGDEVFWYNDSTPLKGTLIGHNEESKPIIKSDFGREVTPDSYNVIRLKNPANYVGPNWLRLPENGKIFEANPEDIVTFDEILKQRIPPGPQYYELITEIWNRGFEIYLVGGTVRDVLAKEPSFDVDLVTTMPLELAQPVIHSMYGPSPELIGNNGYMRIGGSPSSGDPFIDLKNFTSFQPSTDCALFGSDFERDVGHRDFACNSIYYDPINKVFIDPTGRGVADAADKKLHIVCDEKIRSPYHQATVAVRFFKFVCRGYSYSDSTEETLRGFIPHLSAMSQIRKLNYLRTQLLSKHDPSSYSGILHQFKSAIIAFDDGQIWEIYFEPLFDELIAT